MKNGVVRLTGTVPTGARRLEAASAGALDPGRARGQGRTAPRNSQALSNPRHAAQNHTRGPHPRFASVNERSAAISGKTDQIKGRIKEAAGALTDNDRLKQKGKLDQLVGKVKETASLSGVAELVKGLHLNKRSCS